MNEYAIAARFVHLVSVIILMGTSWFRLYAGIGRLKGIEPGVRRVLDRWLWRVMRVAAIVALASAMAFWDALAVNMSGEWSRVLDIDTLKTVLLETQFGEVWIWRLIVAGVLVTILMVRDPSQGKIGSVLTAGLSAILIASLAPTGHAAMHEGLPGLLHKLADGLHLLCAGLWLGGLVPLAYAVYLTRKNTHHRTMLSHVLIRFSQVGYAAVTLVIMTGCVNGIFLISPRNILVTDYGRLLVTKVCIVLTMMALAVINRVALRPRIALPNGVKARAPIIALQTSVIAELALGLLVIGLVSALGALPPAH